MSPVLEVEGLDIRFATTEGEVSAVNDVSLAIDEGESLGVVGESGSGKTQLFLSVMGLLARNGRASGRVRYRGHDILNRRARELNELRGSKISMIFQDPMTSLNPYLKISRQMTEGLVEHGGASEAEAAAAVSSCSNGSAFPRLPAVSTCIPMNFPAACGSGR